MIPLGDARAALTQALTAEGYNVSPGGDLVPMGAVVSPFACAYHETVEGVRGLTRATCEVRAVTDRGDEPSAIARVDDVMTTLWRTLEQAAGPWRALFVTDSRSAAPVAVGDATYASVVFVVVLYV